jgi:hypothetical protein
MAITKWISFGANQQNPASPTSHNAGRPPSRCSCIICRYQGIRSRERTSTIFRNTQSSSLTINPISSSETLGAPNFVVSRPPSTDIVATTSSYANSVLQALYFCNPFRELLLQLPDPSAPSEPSIAQAPQTAQFPPVTTVRKKPERKFSATDCSRDVGDRFEQSPTLSGPPIPSMPRTLSSALRSLFVHISKHPGDKGTVAPRAFIEKLKELNELFRSSMHQDAHEFLNYLLNRIVEEIEEERRARLNLIVS